MPPYTDSPVSAIAMKYGILAPVINLVDWFTLAKKVTPLPPPPRVGSKMRWTLNEETYRVAVQTKKGILQVKSVTDGAGECHDDGCSCVPCAEIRMVPPPPWRGSRRPLKLTFFADEAAWKASLPEGGNIIQY
jgi:hypothetical protein